MADDTLHSTRIEASDPLAAIETYFEKGWTDGLPVIPPTEERILAMLDAMGKAPGDIIGRIPAHARTISAEKLAINAVMAGCLPIYAPVILAVTEALCDPAFSVHGPTASTSGMGILTVVNGPIVSQIGLNARENLFGPGWRANATIGRALRLLLRNVCGAIPGVLDRSCFGHPGKFTYCIAEDETRSPWTPLHVERGFPADESAVTIFAGEHRKRLTTRGWTKRDVRVWLHEHAVRSGADLARAGRLPPPQTSNEAAQLYSAVFQPPPSVRTSFYPTVRRSPRRTAPPVTPVPSFRTPWPAPVRQN